MESEVSGRASTLVPSSVPRTGMQARSAGTLRASSVCNLRLFAPPKYIFLGHNQFKLILKLGKLLYVLQNPGKVFWISFSWTSALAAWSAASSQKLPS